LIILVDSKEFRKARQHTIIKRHTWRGRDNEVTNGEPHLSPEWNINFSNSSAIYQTPHENFVGP